MKQEQFRALVFTFKAFGMSMNQVAEAFKRAANAAKATFNIYDIRRAEHRRTCTIIARAISVNTDPVYKSILWNLFKNCTL